MTDPANVRRNAEEQLVALAFYQAAERGDTDACDVLLGDRESLYAVLFGLVSLLDVAYQTLACADFSEKAEIVDVARGMAVRALADGVAT